MKRYILEYLTTNFINFLMENGASNNVASEFIYKLQILFKENGNTKNGNEFL